jgi:uncharacterized repeat protein (TIGR03803 family)
MPKVARLTYNRAAALVMAMLLPWQAHALTWTEAVLRNFGPPPDGQGPLDTVTMDPAGNLYATTRTGGPNNGYGTVVKLTRPAAGSSVWKETVLHTFTNYFGTGKIDGAVPWAELIMDGAGNLYGTTFGGGLNRWGVVFELSPPVTATGVWTETVLYSFSYSNGASPYGGLVFDAAGNLYGTTAGGGASGGGTVFRLAPPAAGKKGWTESVLYSFTEGADGYFPSSGLLLDHAGNLYGATGGGGSRSGLICHELSGCGTIYELSPPALGGKIWTERTLHIFMGADGTYGAGLAPFGHMLMDKSGNIYGSTPGGGATGNGTVFQLAPPTVGAKTWKETVLYSFTGGADKSGPQGDMVLDKSGNLYGATHDQYGTVFELSPPRPGLKAWTETTLISFSGLSGEAPAGGIIADSAGNIYGTTQIGGSGACSNGCGTIFRLTP